LKTVLVLIPILVVTVLFLIRAGIFKKQKQIYLLKPISTLLVIAVAFLSFLEPTHNVIYSTGVLLALVFSLGGDIALMFKEKRKAFSAGLGLFLVAHIIYAVIFITLGRFSPWDILSTIILLVIAVGFYKLIQPNLGAMKGPVILYILVISVMVGRAVSTFSSPVFTNGQAMMIALGSILFYFSDMILAANRFWIPWKYNRVGLAFYYTGQLLIALAASYFI